MSETYSRKYSKYIDYSVERLGRGGQYIYRFPNGYGASVIPELGSTGVEIAVIQFTEKHFQIVSDTHITNDVLRDIPDLDYRLQQIKGLEE